MMLVVAAVATEVDSEVEVDAEKRGKKLPPDLPMAMRRPVVPGCLPPGLRSSQM
jgi:hypothetical protein